MKKITSLLLFLAMLLLLKPAVHSHCEVPCGIYNDQMRFTMLEEHIATIEKAINQISVLSKENPQNMNQIVRWVMNKEKHAEEIQHIVSQYFMTQRIKPTNKAYALQIRTLHQMLIYAMKAKQTVDPKHVAELRGQVDDFAKLYFSAEDLEHLKEHHDG